MVLHAYWQNCIVLTLLGEREISVDEGDGVAEVCVELVFLPNDEFSYRNKLAY